ncbi:MAG: hypothetical protein AAGA80_08480 [Cyanobacteria bacterium P01_F01_bin.143]
MLNFINFKKITKYNLIAAFCLSTSFVGLLANAAYANDAPTIEPPSFSIDEGVGNTITLERTVKIELEALIGELQSVAPDKIDILFLSDNTGSMGSAIANVRNNAQDLLNDIRSDYSDSDIKFGVARYYGAPKEYGNYNYDSEPGEVYNGSYIGTITLLPGYTETWDYIGKTYVNGNLKNKYLITMKDSAGNFLAERLKSSNKSKSERDGFIKTHTSSKTRDLYELIPVEMRSYELQEEIGATDSEAIDAINDWHASGGKDWEEANFFALHQAATSGAATNLGWQTGYETNWRDDAMKIIVWFGDAPSHTSDTTQAETIAALNNNDVYVVAVDVDEIDDEGQASSITAATNGSYASSSSNQVASTMETLIGNAVENYVPTTTEAKINIDFRTSADTPLPEGMTVTYVCTAPEPDGCNNVGDGETRTFEMTVTGNSAGNYIFDTEVFNVDTSNEVVDAYNDINLHNID